ncbi:hypothetical protein COHA_010634 [Chlorella ohadii]|uniref:Ribonuclease H2 subunit B n=1 Tax=Chlorella ohadii TaxID=2649997 RepID=A0AAD5GX06_9CHLO|nr:hypothetical protein COHA_010634 [Chlorella ohadii]
MQCKPGDTRVFIGKGLAEDGDKQFITLRDPKSGQPAAYLLAGGCLQEINWFKQQYSSWFIGERVLQDGGLYVATPVDPLLLVLPLLERARAQQNVFQDLEQILSMAASPSAHLLAPLLEASGQLTCLCDAKAAGGQSYYRLNDDKRGALQQEILIALAPIPYISGMDELGLTAYAAGLLGEYLAQHWQDRLAKALDLPDELPAPAHAPPSADYSAQSTEKKPRVDPKEAAKAKAAEARQAAKAAKLAKEASGMRKLSAFFQPKAK